MLRELSDAEIALADALGVLRSQVAKGIAESVVDPAMATSEEADRVLAILRDPRRRHAMQKMVERAVPHQAGRPDWPKIEELERRYTEIQQPCLIIWGGRDELFPESMGHRLVNLIPNAKLRVVVAAKHCLPTEHPQVSTDLIRGFIAGSDGRDKIVYFEPPLQRRSAVIALADLPMRTITRAQVSLMHP